MKRILTISTLLSLIFVTCEPVYELVQPEFKEESILNGTDPIPAQLKPRLEGVYRVVKGSDKFGEVVVVKWSNDILSLFGRKSGAYFILKGGIKDSLILFEGKWRYAVSLETGLTRLVINKKSGIDSLLSDSTGTKTFAIVGTSGEDDNFRSDELKFTFIRPFSNEVKTRDYYILAHRGGGRSSDFLGASENTLEMIGLAEQLGANSIEIDVKLSKDNVPFLYHDSNINLREAKRGLLLGSVEDFTIAQLKSFVELKYGEKIPTLREALEYVLYYTNLKFVWLDMKSDKNSMPLVIEIQQDILSKAAAIGRKLEILVGLPTDFMLNNLLAYSNYQNIPSICELSIDELNKANSQVWAPRWTLGTFPAQVQYLHNQGKRAFTWTVDQAQFIQQFIYESEYDGMVTNYPTIVASIYYAK